MALNGKPVHLVVGDADEFVSEQALKQFERFLHGKNIDYTLRRYHGRHKIDATVLLELTKQIKNSDLV